MALVSNIQLQDGSVKPPNLDTNLKYTAAGLTATEAIAVGTVPVSTSGSITVKSANDIRNWIQTTKTDGNVEIYMSNDARPDWALRVAGTADNAFVIANSYGTNCTAQFPAFSIGGAGAVGIGKTGATNVLDIAYKNAATGGVQITQTQNNVGIKAIAESSSGAIGTSSNHKLGFRVNNTTVAAFNTSTQFGIGTDSPGATLDVRGGAIFNEAGAAVDFRIEGDAQPNLFFVDGSADAIGMGTATPVDTSTLHIMGTDGDPSATHSGDAMLIVENNGNTLIEIATSNTTYGGLNFSDAAAATRGAVLYDHGTGLGGGADTMHFQVAGGIKAVIDSDGEVGIGTLAPAAPLHIKKDGDPEIRIEAAADGDAVINFYQTTSCKATVAYQDTNDVFAIASNGTIQLQKTATTKLTISDCVGIGTTAPVAACNAQLDIYNTGATTALQLRSGNTSAAAALIRGEGYRANGDNEQVLQIVGRNKNALIDLGIFEVAAEAKHCTGALEFKTFDGSSMTQKMIITSAGKVGIGTASPSHQLNVFGCINNGIKVQANTDTDFAPDSGNANDALIIQNSTAGDNNPVSMYFATGSNGEVRLSAIDDATNGDANFALTMRRAGGNRCYVQFWDAGTGNVGIGTTAPGDKLDVRGGAIAVYGQNTSHAACVLKFGHEGSGLHQIRAYGVDATTVGKLEVTLSASDGAPACDVMTISEDNVVICGSIESHRTGGGFLNLRRNDGTGTANESLGIVDFISSDASTGSCGIMARIQGAYDSAGDSAKLRFYTGASTGSGTPTITERLTILSGGNVGIGTTAPAHNLHVFCSADNAVVEVESSASNSNPAFRLKNDAQEWQWQLRGAEADSLVGWDVTGGAGRLYLTTAGNLGLGTTCPTSRVMVEGTGTTTLNSCSKWISIGAGSACSYTANNVYGIGFGYTNVDNKESAAFFGYKVTNAAASGAGRLLFATRASTSGSCAPTERMTIDSSGNVGIGTTAPGDNLHIQADQPGIRFTDTAGSSDILVDAAGSCYGIYMRADGSNTNLFLQSGSDNRVGISTTAPCCTAHVYGELMVGKGQSVNANALIALNSTTAAGYGGILQGTSNNGIDWQIGHYSAVLGSTQCSFLKLQAFGGISIGACATGANSVEHMFIASNGHVSIGGRDRGNVFYEGGHSAVLQLEGTTPGNSGLSLIRNNAQYGPNIVLARSCGTSVGSNTLVATGQTIGGINWQANDGTDFVQAAVIAAKVGNHAAANCMSGELQFYTTDGTNGSLQERMRIVEDGKVGIGTLTPNPNLHVIGSIGSTTHMTAQGGIYFSVAPGAESEPTRITTAASGGGTCTLFIGNAAITVSSDIRVKNNIQCYTCSAVDVLDNARVVEFEYDKEKISDKSDFGPSSRGKYVGLIAQEMIEYARWAINDGEGDPEGEHIWKAEYEHMVPLLIKAVQELNERIEELESK